MEVASCEYHLQRFQKSKQFTPLDNFLIECTVAYSLQDDRGASARVEVSESGAYGERPSHATV